MLYFIRHLERYESPDFFTSLTEKGLRDADDLLINTRSIPMVFCSPFKRCIQTMLPYCKNRNIPIYVDYHLYEYLDDPRVQYNKTLHDLPEYKKYCHELNDYEMTPTEDEETIRKRAREFMDKLKTHYSKIDVIVCSHLSTINAMLERDNLETFIPYGGIVKVQI